MDPAFAAAVHRADRAVLSEPTTLAAVGLGMVVMVVWMVAFVTLPLSLVMWLLILVGFPGMILGGHWVRHRITRGNARQAAAALLTDGICAGCGYNLAGLPDDEGVTVCSECGAAWRTRRIVRRHTFAPRPELARPGVLRRLWEWAKAVEFQGPTRFQDDVGVARPMVSPRLVWPIRAAEGERRDRLRTARAEMLAHGRVGRRVSATTLPLVFLLPLAIKGLAGFRPGDAPIILLMLFNLVQFPLVVLRGAQGIRPEHIEHAMLGAGLCHACGGDMPTDGAADGDGLVRCPECGAAWRVSGNAGSQSPARSEG